MAREYTPEELGIKPEREYTLEELESMHAPESGGIASFKSALHDIAGQGALTLGKVGLMNPEEAQKSYEEHKEKSAGIYKPTEKGWTEDPFGKFGELIGGSVPYMAAPLVGAVAAPELIGGSLVGAGLASAGQFVGSNLARQLDEGQKEGKNLADTSLTSAVAASIPQAILDTYSLKMTPLIRGIFGKAGKEITEKTAEQIAKKGILGTITETGLSANREGITEAGQQVLERLQAGLNLTDEEARKEYFDNYIGGAVLGGTLGAAGHFVEKSMQNNAESRYDALMNDLRNHFDTASQVPMTDVINKISDLTGETDLNKIQNFLGGAEERGHLETVPNEDDTLSIKFKQPTPIEQEDEKDKNSNPDIYKPEVFDSHADLYKAIVPKLRKFGLENVGVKIMDSIENGRADGLWANKIIHLAMDSANPVGAMRHESVHALRELGGFKPNEWTVLNNKAKDEWLDRFIKKPNLYDQYKEQYLKDYGNLDGFEDYIHEEAIAEAFKHFDQTKPPAGLVGNIYERLKQFFETVRNGFAGNGFHTADSIFRSLEEGKRPSVAPKATEVINEEQIAPQYALKAPEGIPQELFDAYGKMADADEVALKNNYGSTKRNATMASKRFLEAVKNHLVDTGELKPNEEPTENKAWRDLTSTISNEYRKAKEENEQPNRYSFARYDEEGRPIQTTPSNGAEAGELSRRGELLGGERRIPQPSRVLAPSENLDNNPPPVTIPSLGQVAFGAHPQARQVAYEYMANKPYFPATSYVKVDPERAKRIANAYQEMKDEPNNPEVKASYNAMIKETLDQWQAIKKTGLKVEFMKEGMDDPYAESPRLAILDAIHNNHLWVFPTDFGYGEGNVFDVNNPLLAYTDEIISGKRARVNDIFRIVHDYFGHIKDGVGFRADGEENAWRSHVQMYSPLARKAMTTETRGQNSWVNFGPYADFNKTASAVDTKYAPQKIGLLPDEFVYSGSPADTDHNLGEENAKKYSLAKYDKEGNPIRPTENAVRPSEGGNQGISLNDRREGASTFVGHHYSKGERQYLSGSMYGSKDGIKGEEAKRLANTKDPRIKKRVYFYIPHSELNGRYLNPEEGLGPFKHEQTFNNILAPGTEMSRIIKETDGTRDFNRFESAVVDAGYDGYAFPHMGMMVILNQDNVPVNSVGKRSLRAPNTPAFRAWFKGSKVVNENGKPLVMYHGTPYDYVSGKEQGIFNTKDFGALLGKGAYFTVDPKEAEEYTGKLAYGIGIKPNIIPAFINLKNPFIAKSTLDKVPKRDELAKQGYDGVLLKKDGKIKWAVAFEPNQIKSAFNQEPTTSNDIRYSLKAPNTPTFKRWFGNSKIVNPDGIPKVMYHGTAQDISEFRPKQANAIFVTDSPRFAESFSESSEDYMVKALRASNDLPLPKVRKIVEESIKDARKNESISVEEAKKLREMGSRDAMYSPKLSDFVYPRLKDELPSRANIIPVFVRAENPFDFQNPQHLKRLQEHLDADYFNNIYSDLKSGDWQTIEAEDIQEAIQLANFDGFYVKEGGRKNLAVYEPTQLKSATGNQGTFDIKNPDIRYSLPRLTKTEAPKTTVNVVKDTATKVWDDIHNDNYLTKKRVEWVDKTSGLTKALQGLPQFDMNGKLRADLLIRAKSQGINYIKNAIQSGIPILNTDGTLGVKRSENNLARSLILADQLDAKFKPFGFTGRGGVAEVARILRGEDIIKEDDATRAQGSAMIAQANAHLKMAQDLKKLHKFELEYAKQLTKEAKALYNAGKLREGNLKASEARRIYETNFYREILKETKEARKLMREGKPLLKVNRELQVTPAHIRWAHNMLDKIPEIENVLGIWREVNRGLVDLWVDTGLLDEKTAQKFKARDRYVPLFKSREDLDNEGLFNPTGTGIKSTAKIHALKGGTSERNIWENIDKHFAKMVAQAYENQTRRVGVDQLKYFGLAMDTTDREKANILYKEDGKVKMAIVENPNDLAAFQAMTYQISPLIKTFVPMTKALRAGALINPMYWIKQLIRDPIHASLVANSGIVTPFHSMVEFAQILAKNSEEAKILADRGVIGAVDSTMSMNEFLRQVGKEKTEPHALAGALHKIMEIHEASDAATRVAIYKKAYAEGMKKFGNTQKATDYAVFKARESINFSVHGNSPILQNLRSSIPFFSAAITSLDTVYRAATGYGLNEEEKAQARRIFATRAAMMAFLSTVYAMMYQDDDEYKKLPDYVKDNNWLIPTPDGKSFIKVPTPFEIGFLFKTIPEGAVRYMTGTSTGKELVASYYGGLLQNLPANGIPVPQAIKPILEDITNHSFFTGNPIEGMSDQGLPVSMRGQRATEFSKMLSRLGLDGIGLSPAKIDNLFQGYFAELGTFSTEMASDVINLAEGRTPPAKNIENMPFMKSFLTDPNISKAVSDFYSLEANAKQMAEAFNKFKSEGNIEGINSILADEEKKKAYASSAPLRKIGEEMTKIRKAINYYKENQDISPEERRQRINELTQVYNKIAENGYVVANAVGINR